MKIKILLAPLLIVSIIVLLVWFIYPLWTNGSDGIKEKMSEYEMQKNRQMTLEKKKEAIVTVAKEVNGRVSEANALFRFLPKEMSEEELIDKMQFLASKKQEEAGAGWEMGPGSFQVLLSKNTAPIKKVADANQPTGQGEVVVFVTKNLTDFSIDFEFIGPYEKVKEIVKNIYTLKRFNKAVKFQAEAGIVKREGALLKWEDSKGEPADGLKVLISLNFNYFNIGKVTAENINDPVFSPEQLGNIDWGVIETIQKRETEIVPLTDPVQGRGNPFLLPSQ